MKKTLLILAGFVLAGLVACGPSAEEKKAQEEALQKAADDSTANALLDKASVAASDSVMAVPADSTMK